MGGEAQVRWDAHTMAMLGGYVKSFALEIYKKTC